jgi:hypothetical protein
MAVANCRLKFDVITNYAERGELFSKQYGHIINGKARQGRALWIIYLFFSLKQNDIYSLL